MREELKSGSFNSSASRVPSSSEAITQRVLKILRQPSGDTKPDAAAKLFAVAYQIGDGTSNLPGVNQAPVVLQPSAPNVTNRIFTRDGESDKAARIYHDFFARHPEHLQAQRFIQEYRHLVADASALPNGENDNEGGISNDGC